MLFHPSLSHERQLPPRQLQVHIHCGGFHTVANNSFLPAIIYQFKILKKKSQKMS